MYFPPFSEHLIKYFISVLNVEWRMKHMETLKRIYNEKEEDPRRMMDGIS